MIRALFECSPPEVVEAKNLLNMNSEVMDVDFAGMSLRINTLSVGSSKNGKGSVPPAQRLKAEGHGK